MAGSFVGAATGTTSADLTSLSSGTLAVGDLIIARAFRDGNNTAPTIPSTTNPWIPLDNSAGSNSNGAAIAWKIAASGDTTGTWTSATRLDVGVWRGFSGCSLIAVDGAASTTVNYPSLGTLGSPNNWVAGFAAHRSTNTSLETPPTGMTNRFTNATGTDEGAIHDTNGGVSSWSGTTVSVGGTSSGWRAHTVELVLAATSYSLVSSHGSFSFSGQNAALKHDRKLISAQGSFSLSGRDATLRATRTFIAAQGSYSLAGQNATLKVTRLLTAGQGSFSLNGQNVFLSRGRILTAAQGSFSLSGQDAVLNRGKTLVVDYGAFTLAGQDAGLRVHRILTAALGSLALSGQDASFSKEGRKLIADRGGFVLSGQDVLSDGVGSLLGFRLFGDNHACYTFDS